MYDIYVKAVLLAVLEGLTEFIPVSSTGHMIIFGHWINFTGEKADTFEIFIQLGAILAVVVIYSDKFLGLIPEKKDGKSWLKTIFQGDSNPTLSHITVATIPVLIIGFLLYKTIKTYLFGPITVAIGLIVGGVLMIIAEKLPLVQETDSVEEISIRQALIVGLGQCLAMWPGMSRSGSTMITSLLVGIKHKPAADFSFIIAVPVMFAAVGYDLLKSWHFLALEDFSYFGVGFVLSFVVAWFSIKWFLRILTTFKLLPFGLYRVCIGALVLYLSF
jgi:undecaprenyl-diphosphatase